MENYEKHVTGYFFNDLILFVKKRQNGEYSLKRSMKISKNFMFFDFKDMKYFKNFFLLSCNGQCVLISPEEGKQSFMQKMFEYW